jgi:beta-lactamase regulating signal transducer with metallopeptidase domain
MSTGLTFTFGWTLLHFLWQGTAIALLVWMVLTLVRRARPEVRYLIAWAGMALMAAAPIATFIVLQRSPSIVLEGPAPVATAAKPMDIAPPDLDYPSVVRPAKPSTVAAPMGWRGRLDRVAPNLLPFWLAGVLLLTLRLAGGIGWLARARRRSRPLEGEWAERVEILRRHFGVARTVALRVLDEVEGPMVAGILKPMILVPTTLLTGLPAAQVELLLAHEIAHIARHDVLANALQRTVETLLFFHPAVWALGRRLRQERERCCDAMAAEFLGDPCGLAEALTSLADLHRMPALPAFALGATEGSLTERVHALLDFHAPVNRMRLAIAGGLVLLCLGTGWGLTRIRARRLARIFGPVAASQNEQGGQIKLQRFEGDLRVEFEVKESSADEVLAAFARAEARLGQDRGETAEMIQRPGKLAPGHPQPECFTVSWQSLTRPQFLEYWHRLKARPALDCPADTLVVRRDNLGLPWDSAEDPALDVWVPKYADQFSPEGARLLREAILELKALAPTPGLPQEVRRKLPEPVLAALKSPEAGTPILRGWTAHREDELIRLCHEEPYEAEGGFRYALNSLQLDLKAPGIPEQKAWLALKESLTKHQAAAPKPVRTGSASQRAAALQVRKAWREQEQKLYDQIDALGRELNQKGYQSALQQIVHRLAQLGDKAPLLPSRGRKARFDVAVFLPRPDGTLERPVLRVERLHLDPALLRQSPTKEAEELRKVAEVIQERLGATQRGQKAMAKREQG